MSEDHLDSLFAAARAEPLRPPRGLSARVLDDAARHMASVAPPPALLSPALLSRAAPPRPGLWAALSTAFGGGGALAGMVTATVAGFYIGFAQPIDTGIVTAVLAGDAAGGEIGQLDMMPGIDALLDEAP